MSKVPFGSHPFRVAQEPSVRTRINHAVVRKQIHSKRTIVFQINIDIIPDASKI